MEAKLYHLSIIVKNLDEAMRLFSDVFGYKQPKSGPWSKVGVVDEPGVQLKYAMLRMNDGFLQLVEPIEGVRTKLLKEKGEGTIYEIAFQVEDIEKAYDEMKKRGLTPVDRYDSPLIDKKYILEEGAGTKWFFLAREKTCGVLIELAEVPAR